MRIESGPGRLWAEFTIRPVAVWVRALPEVYHREDCPLLGEERLPVAREAAIAYGLRACEVCEP